MAYNKIILYGEQVCDYIYIQKDAPGESAFSRVDEEPSAWSDTTSLYANFNNKENRLAAGDSEVSGSIEGYEIYRKKYDESHAKYIGTVKKGGAEVSDLMIDFAAKNGVDYTYYLYPNVDVTKGGAPLSPFVTKQLSIDCPFWSLFIVDETEEDNVFYLDKMFKFELNLQVDDMSNNAQISITQNFTKYPTIQYGAANYWSGSLTSLCGFISANDVDYIQNTNMINELKNISSDTRRKFLKDTDGNLWEVNVSAPINISTDNATQQMVKSLKFSWVEVGDAENVSIINNPYMPIEDWVLTESGVAVPYSTYQWGAEDAWNNSYLWTSSGNAFNIKTVNLGRDIEE